jgi:hypothetical protein
MGSPAQPFSPASAASALSPLPTSRANYGASFISPPGVAFFSPQQASPPQASQPLPPPPPPPPAASASAPPTLATPLGVATTIHAPLSQQRVTSPRPLARSSLGFSFSAARGAPEIDDIATALSSTRAALSRALATVNEAVADEIVAGATATSRSSSRSRAAAAASAAPSAASPPPAAVAPPPPLDAGAPLLSPGGLIRQAHDRARTLLAGLSLRAPALAAARAGAGAATT